MAHRNVTRYDPDGRYAAQYAVDHCVCAYCWSNFVQIYDEDSRQWKAVCSENPDHIGGHHRAFMELEIQRHTITRMEVAEFYRETIFAAEFGLTPRLKGQALQDQFSTLKRALGRDGSGLS